MESEIGIIVSYVVGTCTGWWLFAAYNREWIVGQTLAMLAREGVIAVEKTEDGDLSVTAIPDSIDEDEVVLKLIEKLEALQREVEEELEENKDSDSE